MSFSLGSRPCQRHLGTVLVCLGACSLIALAFAPRLSAEKPAAKAEAAPRLEVLARFTVPSGPSDPFDVRWSGRDSIYVAYASAGVRELDLRQGLPQRRQVLPGEKTQGFRNLTQIAISDQWLMTAPPSRMVAWRPRHSGGTGVDVRVKRLNGLFFDIDLDGDRIALLGVPTLEAFKKSKGGLLWLGSISSDLEEWEPVMENEAVAADFGVFHSRQAAPGAVRFLHNGDFVAVPSFVPGVFLFSPAGKLKKTWRNADLCGTREETEGGERESAGPTGRGGIGHFLASTRLIDEVLPLPEGPGLVVREPGKGGRWRLAVLGSGIGCYDIPISGLSAAAQLRGDVDERGRIVLMAVGRGTIDEARIDRSEVVLLALPK